VDNYDKEDKGWMKIDIMCTVLDAYIVSVTNRNVPSAYCKSCTSLNHLKTASVACCVLTSYVA